MSEPSEDQLPLPGFVNWPNFPFEGELRVKPVEPYKDFDAPRIGEADGADCQACAAQDDAYIWTNEWWRLKTLAPFSPLPVSLVLETREHLDLGELSSERAADLGRITVELTRLTEAMPAVGRLHSYRWGEGASHCHIWYLGRPFGAEQLSGLTLPMWGLTLPPLEPSVTDPINQAVVDHMTAMSSDDAHSGR